MNRLVCALISVIFGAAFSFGQVTITGVNPIQTGFVVVTPLYGGGPGLSVSGTLATRMSGNLVQSSVLSSPLVTRTSIVVNFDSNSAVNTAVAIVNPNGEAAGITLTLRDQSGAIFGIRNITIGGEQQLSRFATQLFPRLEASSEPFEGLLFLSSNAPIGVLGLAFNGSSFASLPVATQLNPNGPVDAPFSLVGPSGILLAQLATGGGWESRITIANTGTVPQVIRIDFFNSLGGPLALPIGTGVPFVTVPAAGVVTFSTVR
jgi:hypothetical protein